MKAEECGKRMLKGRNKQKCKGGLPGEMLCTKRNTKGKIIALKN
jgi:hypothetical protein